MIVELSVIEADVILGALASVPSTLPAVTQRIVADVSARLEAARNVEDQAR